MARSSRDSIPGGYLGDITNSVAGAPIHPGVKISDLRAKIMRPSLTSVYGVMVEQPPGWKYQGFDKQLLELTCVEASLPGSS